MVDPLLKDEYFHLQRVVEEFDARTLTIKAWSVTLITTGLGAAHLQQRPGLYLVASTAALLFWLIEAMWKTFQYAYYPRIWAIENHLAGKQAEIVPLQVATAWSAAWHAGGKKQFLRQLFWPHVMLPHTVAAALGVLLYLGSRLPG